MARKKLILCDSNILIHVLRGNEDVKARLDHISWENICISIITATELYYGARNKEEPAQPRKFMA